MSPRENPYFLKVVAKTFRVIEMMAQNASGMKLSQLARELNQPKATVFRILYTLKELGYVKQDASTETYQVTREVGWLTQNELQETLRRTARPFLERLLAHFEQTVCLAMLDQDQLLYIKIMEGLRSIRMAATVNTYAPLHSTALGKAILSCLDLAEVEDVLKQRPPIPLTPNTITSVRVLIKHLAQVREQGYAVDNEESEEGARCVGAAICNSESKPLAAISVSGPTSHMPGDRISEIASEVREACQRISKLVAFQGERSRHPNATARGLNQ